MIRTSLASAIILSTISVAHSAPPLVNPVIVPLGGPAVHLTPHAYDQSGVEVPVSISQCTIVNVPATIVTITYDATGALLTAVGTGSSISAQWRCVNNSTVVNSAMFTVTVPWSVTAVGDTMP